MKTSQRRAGKIPGAAFWRLLGDYEDLSRSETAALHGEDFASLVAIQSLKSAVFAAMDESCRRHGINRSESALLARMEKIAAGETANLTFLTQRLAANAAERRALSSARARLRSLQHSYVSLEPRQRCSFLALG